MREITIARSYAETLVELARRAGDLDGWGAMIDEVANAIAADQRLVRFLETPRVSAREKNEVIGKAFADRLPRLFVRFLQAVVTQRRQHLIGEIAFEYHAIVDQLEGRVHADVTLARQPDPAMAQAITEQLSRVLDKKVVPHFNVRPDILGGTIVRVGDTVMDGSVRHRLNRLRTRMLSGVRARTS
ncbi:MAG TPA: ATP synthase F1 subunit delta [Gemmatimonadaceae bacterium]|nr:ATP synthase F1 subunit delta [Gemmatimonadaceae bacterium]